jgi:protocatechuate 4,5-dioxygenase beta chain
MAILAGGFCVPHDPLILGARNAAEPAQAERVFGAFAEIRSRAAALRPDAAIVIGDDHCAMFDPACQPSLLIGIGELEGPIEPWLGLERKPVPCAAPLAEFVMNFGFERGFDWAIAKTLALDHSTMVPIHLALPAGLPVVPVYISSGMKPFIRARRCRELGEMLGDAIRAMPGGMRVLVVGTGGISHWVGMADMGRINETFDRRILDMASRGDVDGLAALSDEEIVASAGNGALEIRNWIVAMACLRATRGTVVGYEPVLPWITGLGFIELSATSS